MVAVADWVVDAVACRVCGSKKGRRCVRLSGSMTGLDTSQPHASRMHHAASLLAVGETEVDLDGRPVCLRCRLALADFDAGLCGPCRNVGVTPDG